VKIGDMVVKLRDGRNWLRSCPVAGWGICGFEFSRFSCTVNLVRQSLTLSNPIFLPTAYSLALICFGQERGWWIICKYPTVLKEKNIENQKVYNLRYLLAKVRTT
jgi:hypothetical protein